MCDVLSVPLKGSAELRACAGQSVLDGVPPTDRGGVRSAATRGARDVQECSGGSVWDVANAGSDTLVTSWIDERFGSRRGFLHAARWSLPGIFGRQRRMRSGSVVGVERLVFVCMGNLYRSAFAAAVAEHNGMPAASCGLRTGVGAPAADRCMAVAAREHGVSLEAHRTTPIQRFDFSPRDLVLLFDPVHVRAVREHAGVDSRLECLGYWSRSGNPYFCDPYSAPDAYLRRCLGRIDEATRTLVRHVRSGAVEHDRS